MEKGCTKISVIMGIYNCEATLEEALDSLIAQTYKGFKVIMCDDGSTDGTYRIAQMFVDRNANFILLRNEKNMGLNATLNYCLSYADTEYIARMDGDDVSLPTRFEKELSFLESNPEIDIVSCNMIYFDEVGDYKVSNVIEWPKAKDFKFGTPFCHAPCLVRTSAYRKVNGYSVDNRLLRVEDYHLWFKMYSNGCMGHNIKEPLYKMRDDRNAYLRRRLKYRINEAYVMSLGFRMLRLPLYYQVFALKPIIVGMLPGSLYKYLHRSN